MSNVSTPSRPAENAAKTPSPTPVVASLVENEAKIAPASPTRITLFVRSCKERFERNHYTAAQEAGFGTDKVSLSSLALVNRDTGNTIASLRWHGGKAAFGELDTLTVECDPERCEYEWGAGERLIRSIQSLCDLLDGYLADGTGRELTSEEKEAIGEHIDTVLERRSEKEHADKRVVLPSGDIRFPGALSFQSYTHRKLPGKRTVGVDAQFFEAPELPWHAGRAHGEQMALEMMQFYQQHELKRPEFTQMLASALGAVSPRGSYKRAMRENVVVGFLDVIEELVRFASRSCSTQWVEKRVASNRGAQTHIDGEAARGKAEFVERMRAAKVAKKSGVQGGAA